MKLYRSTNIDDVGLAGYGKLQKLQGDISAFLRPCSILKSEEELILAAGPTILWSQPQGQGKAK